MDNREIAGKIGEILSEDTWWDGTPGLGGDKLCLAQALGKVLVNTGDARGYVKAYTEIITVIETLFPGRLNHASIPRFNDDPDTTWGDISLVLKHFADTAR